MRELKMKKIDKVSWSSVEILAYGNLKERPHMVSDAFGGIESKVVDVVAHVVEVTCAQIKGNWLE